MTVGYMQGSKRARSIPSLTNSNQCGGPKKAGAPGRYMTPRNNWLGGTSVKQSVFFRFPTCALLNASGLMTKNPTAGGIGKRFR